MNNVGWDIGGAHVKLAYIKNNVLCVQQWDCPLWKGLNELVAVVKIALNEIPQDIANHHVTMTGELVDIFTSRDHGVREIMRVFLEQVTTDTNVKFFSRDGLVEYEQALLNTESIASANWIASGLCVSKKNESVIFIDMGSTTTDIIGINKGELALSGLTDFERLRSGDLVYTGVVRSCVNTLCQKIPYKGDYIPLMAEYFSMSADVYRILDWLPEHADYGDTMDGQPKDQVSSMRRLARMIGEDYRDQDRHEWISVAQYIAEQQMKMIEVSLSKYHTDNVDIVAAGVGRFLIEKIANKLSANYKDFTRYIIPADIDFQSNASDCAPAVALVFE
ncbi:MAG: hydantoinase/oxoprolinase family protein [Gammaproteobacteria bacterium]